MQSNSSEWWLCPDWDVRFCKYCIMKFARNTDAEELKQFDRENNKHFTHCHPLKLTMYADVKCKNKIEWYGKHSSTGCNTDTTDPNVRYLECKTCWYLLCENCYLLKPENYWKTPDIKVHKHPLFFMALRNTFTFRWSWDLKSDNCVKHSKLSKRHTNWSYRWNIWDFDICIEWAKSIPDKIIKE